MRWSWLVLPVALVACNNPCERLREVAEDKAQQCGNDVGQDTGSSELECSESDAQMADCLVPCYRHAPCGAFDGSDMGAASELLQCMTDCARNAQ